MTFSLFNFFLAVTIFFSSFNIKAQNAFQQQVDFKIVASLDTLNQSLNAQCTIKYKNNSSVSLDKIYLHLWWNAYGDKRSAYAEQQLRLYEMDFHFSDAQFSGSYEKFYIEQEGSPLDCHPFKKEGHQYSDIVEVILNTPCAANTTVELIIDYSLKIPYNFSRAGYGNDVYRFTQWYPKPAVFDSDGWHPMPYLDMGEIYYDFGNYDINLSIPSSFVVGHTGELSSIEKNDSIQIISYNAKNVVDFAWFASEKFIKESRRIRIKEKEIELNVLRKKESHSWKNALDLLQRSSIFYSDKIGEYPYSQISIVEGSSSRSSDMEYPMVAIIDHKKDEQVLDHLIAHEIGHNWFYGILATNERKHPWMDEGLNSFHDHQYNDANYKKPLYNEVISKIFSSPDSELSLIQQFVSHAQSINRDSKIRYLRDDIDPMNYISLNYEKIAWALSYLQSYLGLDVFEACIKKYYESYKFKHPRPNDLQSVFESTSEKKLDWFFEGLLNSKERFDYKIFSCSRHDDNYKLIIANNGDLILPFHLTAFNTDNEIIYNKWFEGIAKSERKEIELSAEDVHRFSLNGKLPFLDINRGNNHYFPNNTIFKRQKFKSNLLFKTSDSRFLNTNWIPVLTANAYDGLMTGLAVSNGLFPATNFRWFINTSFGFKSIEPIGIFSMEKDIYFTKGNIRKLTLGLSGKKFHFFSNKNLDYDLKYSKLKPAFTIHFSKKATQNAFLNYSAHLLNTEEALFNGESDPEIKSNLSIVHQLNYGHNWDRRLSRNKILIQLEYEDYDRFNQTQAEYLKLNLDFKKKVYISTSNKFFVRAFGSYFIVNSERESANYSDAITRSSIALSDQGFSDRSFEEYYFARTKQSGLFSRQFSENDSGFKTATGSSQKVGMSNDWAIALNLKSDLPIGNFLFLKFRPFLDLALVNTKSVTNDALKAQFYYSGGIALELGDFFGISLPILNSAEIENIYKSQSFLSRLSFRLNLNLLNVYQYADDPYELVR